MRLSRRGFLRRASVAAGATVAAPNFLIATSGSVRGAVIGEPVGARVGQGILEQGGNAVDAIVGAALASCVVSMHNCGIGGYGGHMVIGMRGRKVAAIDFNTMAPAAAREDMFAPDKMGKVPGEVNETGWLAAGVPGTVAGLDLALKRYGRRTFGEAASPAIDLAENGFVIGQGVASAIRRTAELLKKDSASARTLFKDGAPLEAGFRFRNPELAELLRALSAKDATAEFYRGAVGGVIADAFARNGGLVTRKDMAAYRAKEVEPIRFLWQGSTIWTAPLTGGGLTVIQALAILKALRWDSLPKGDERTLLRVETLRRAWHDRLMLLGDPEKAKVPVRRLLSDSYAEEKAEEIQDRIRSGIPLEFAPKSPLHGGTVHLSAADAQGNMAAITLTHGNAFGARVTVAELGILLGHGMSRFEIKAGHPNSPGPHKRPLHNMCPTIVTTRDLPVLAMGGAGGRKIPNSVFDVLTHHVLLGMPLRDAMTMPRLHTEGNMNLLVEQRWREEEVTYLKNCGYTVQTGTGAVVSARGRDMHSGEPRGIRR